jgi:hypothetical protein
MTRESLFTELIKDLDTLDQRVILVLKGLMENQETFTVQTSRFALCRLLHMAYSEENVRILDAAFDRLQKHVFQMIGSGAGFAVATRAVTDISRDPGSEKLRIRLGSLFLL